MKRVLVMGVGSGVGKSTLARKMGQSLKLPVYHLDVWQWKPGWVEASSDEFVGKMQDTVKQEEWIIEGNYTSTYDLRAERADTIVYIDLPLSVCLYRVLKRRIQYQNRTRPDIGEGCPEKIDYEFLKFIVTTYHSRKKKMKERLLEFQLKDPEREIILLRSRKDVKAFENHLREVAECKFS